MEKNSKYLKQLYQTPGYFTGINLEIYECEIIKKLIFEQYINNILENSPKYYKELSKISMEMYHEHIENEEHSKLWSKRNRTLKPNGLRIIKSLKFFEKLKEIFGEFTITDEDNLGYEEIYWRLVRPNSITDVGDFHTDNMFWEHRKDRIPENTHRVKVWIALYTETGLNGFTYIPDSHNTEINYEVIELENKKLKFKIKNLQDLNQPVLFNSQSGEAIIFNDRLVHSGKIGGEKTRVSIEFTMIVNNKILNIDKTQNE